MKRILILLFCIAYATNSATAQENAVIKVNSGHSLDILSMCFSPDETNLVTSSSDNSMKVWDIASGREIITLTGHTGQVQKVAFTKDGSRLISSSWDRTIKIWDAKTWDLIRTIKIPGELNSDDNDEFFLYNNEKIIATYNGPIIYCFDSESGKLLKKLKFFEENDMVDLTVAQNGMAYASARDSRDLLVDLNAGKEIRGLYYYANSVVFLPDGATVAIQYSKGNDLTMPNELTIEELVSGKVIKKITNENEWPYELTLLPDGKRIAAGSVNSLLICDIASGAIEYKSIPAEGINNGPFAANFNFCYSTTQKFAAFAVGDPVSLTVRDGKTLNQLKSIANRAYVSYYAGFTKDSRHFYSAGTDGLIKKWDLETMKAVNSHGPFNSAGIEFSKNHEYALLPSGGSVKIVRLESDTIRHAASCADAAISSDGKLMAYANRKDSTLVIIDPATSKIIKSFPEAHSVKGGAVTLAFSPDNKYVASSNSADGPLIIWNLQTDKKLGTITGRRSISFLKFPDNKTLVVGQETAEGYFGSKLSVLSIPDLVEKKSIELGAQFDFEVNCFTADGKVGYFGSEYTGEEDKEYPIYKVDLTKGSVITKLTGHKGELQTLALSADENYLVSGSGQNKNSEEDQVRLWDARKDKLIKTIATFDSFVESVAISPDNKFILASGYNKIIKLFRFDGTEVITIVPVKNSNDFIALTPDGYYTSTRGAQSTVHYVKGKKIYPFEQFDIQYNRPDTVLSRIGLASADLIKAYKRAYLKRLKKLNINPRSFESSRSFNIPQVEFPGMAGRYFPVKEKSFQFDVTGKDALHNLVALNVRVNGVPLYGVNGLQLGKNNSKTYSGKISVPLSSGANVIEVTVLNEKGVQSLSERVEVLCEEITKPDLYLIAIGVSNFKESEYNLTYAAKDAKDLAKICNANGRGFGKINVLTLTNEEATKENLPRITEMLKNTKPDDEVIAFVASHGLLDDSLNYYIATNDIEFENPSVRGLAYEELESFLDGIGARQKILLIDACHSGEVDKEETVVVASVATSDGQLKNRGFKAAKKKKAGLGLVDSFELMQTLFADISKGSGTVVISSASGTEFAFESSKWENGVFTFALLEMLTSGKTEMKVSDVRDYVIERVVKLTDGKQHPTSRKENLEFDFKVW